MPIKHADDVRKLLNSEQFSTIADNNVFGTVVRNRFGIAEDRADKLKKLDHAVNSGESSVSVWLAISAREEISRLMYDVSGALRFLRTRTNVTASVGRELMLASIQARRAGGEYQDQALLMVMYRQYGTPFSISEGGEVVPGS